MAALRHFAVKSGSPLTPALRQTLGGSNEAIASAYARDLGFQVASILAHSSGVYLDRISQHALARQ